MRVRIKFSKQGALRYTGHLDLHKIWERSARRAGLPLAYSQGFHPQPRLSLASALPLGYTSRAEVMEMKLKDEVGLRSIAAALRVALPLGIQVLDLESVGEAAPPIQTRLVAAEYEITIADQVPGPDLRARIDRLLGAATLMRERRGKSYDLRPLIEHLSLMDPGGLPAKPETAPATRFFMRLTAREGATGRPDEVLDAMGISANTAQVERTRLIFDQS